jgi:hypothetical protein
VEEGMNNSYHLLQAGAIELIINHIKASRKQADVVSNDKQTQRLEDHAELKRISEIGKFLICRCNLSNLAGATRPYIYTGIEEDVHIN